MRFFETQRDIIIVTGCNAVGKTTASNYLRKLATLYNIPYESRIIADSQCLFEAMEKDDRKHGLHHTHEWCNPNQKSHKHDENQLVFPFTVTDNELPNKMRKSFFKKLVKLPNTNKYWFVEWAGGVNIQADSPINYSYAHVKCLLEKRYLPDKWLKRVKAIIHVTANDEVRFALNKQRTIPFSACPEAIEKGTAFWQKNEQVLGFYSKDDFCEIQDLLQNAGITISMIENNGSNCFFENLEMVAKKIFLSEHIAVVKPQEALSTNTDLAKTASSISGIGATIFGAVLLPFGTFVKNTKADKLPASVREQYLEEHD
jgi:hypothetical protein